MTSTMIPLLVTHILRTCTQVSAHMYAGKVRTVLSDACMQRRRSAEKFVLSLRELSE